jgi:two-component system NarL family sensor kinase
MTDNLVAMQRSWGAIFNRRDQRSAARDAARDAGPPPRIGTAVARFMVGSLLAIAVVVIGGFLALRSVTINEAVRDTRDRVVSDGRLLETVALTDGVLARDPAALAKLDRVVQQEVVTGSVIRVKIWSREGEILYSDEPRLIGLRYQLAQDDAKLFDGGLAAAELSDVSQPENKFERGQGKLLEAYEIVRTPNGTPLLFEIYRQFSSVTADGQRLLRAQAPPIIGGLLVLMLFQVPLAWSLGRRLQRGHRDRAMLLANAVEASAQERRRIASDLHDGVVQNVAGVAFGLAPLVQKAERQGEHEDAAELRRSIDELRQGVRDMRTLLVEIHPPNLESVGLEAALHDLLSPLEARGIATTLSIDVGSMRGDPADALVYRAAREAIRNVQAHAEASSIDVRAFRPEPGTMRLVVTDNGKGFVAADRARAGADGHLGLTLLDGLVEQAGGRLTISSEPDVGTIVTLDWPAPRLRSGGDDGAWRTPEVVPAVAELERELRRADVEVAAEGPVDEALGVQEPEARDEETRRRDAPDEVLHA